MTICTEQWRADFGQFYLLTHPTRVMNLSLGNSLKTQNIFLFFFNLLCCLFLRQHSVTDVKNKAAVEHFSCSHWNVNSLAAHDYQVLLLEPYNAIHHYNLIFVSETYLDFSTSNDDKDISIIRADNLNNKKRGRVCFYFEESLGVHFIHIPNLTESILCQVTINNKKGYLLVVYYFPSQLSDEFKTFLSSFDQVITDISFSNPAFRLILGDFNS